MAKIIVNGKERTYNQERISYAQVVALAYSHVPGPQRPKICSTAFQHADQEKADGILSPKTSVKIKDGTIFHCHNTSAA